MDRLWRSVVKTALATVAFCGLHSFLALNTVKERFARRFGTRARNGLYRPLHNLQAVVTTGALILYIRRQPNQILYAISGPPATLMRIAQILCAAEAGLSTHQVGILKFLALPNLLAWLSGKRDIPKEAEGQGPGPDDADPDRKLKTTMGFRVSRHPLNLLATLLLWFSPRMTVTYATFCGVSTLYLYFGSFHEQARLEEAYGKEYRDYERSGVPFFLPRGNSSKSRPDDPATNRGIQN